MKRKTLSHVGELTESDCAPAGLPDPLKPTKKQHNPVFSAVKLSSGKAAVHSHKLGGVVKGTEVNDMATAEVVAKELNKGRQLDDVKYLISLMESAQQK